MLSAALKQMPQVFTSQILMRGSEIQHLGYVLSLRLGDGLLKGRVRSGLGQIFDVYLDLKSWPQIPGRCKCDQIGHCEHAAACLFELQSREQLNLVPSFLTRAYQPSPNLVETPFTERLEFDDFEWFSELEGQKNDFFSYQLGIQIAGESISVVPLILDILKSWDPKKLEDAPLNHEFQWVVSPGKVMMLPLSRIKPMIDLLLHYGRLRNADAKTLTLSSYQLLLVQEAEQALLATKARWHATEEVRFKLEQMASKNMPLVAIPKGLKTELRTYQQQGLSWLQYLCEHQFSGVLADDMGLGKTVQTLAHLLLEKEQGRLKSPCLILAPTSLLWNWQQEAVRFTPDLRVLVFHGAVRHKESFADYDVIISTYGLIQRDKMRFLDETFYYLILDEAQWIKNTRTLTNQVVQQIKARHRLCLTGTPLENHLGELWALFHFLMPGFLGTAKYFRQSFRLPIERDGDAARQALLVKRLQPFMLRRTKNQVVMELPEKTEMVRFIDLAGPQRDVYESIRMSMESNVRNAILSQGLGRSHIVLLDALLKLRQLCCDPRLVALPEAKIAHGISAKLDALMDLLDNLMQEERRVLIFSQFTSMLRLIEQALTAKHYSYLKLTGQSKNRQALVEAFQNGEAPIFLISLKAGGTGLNLTRADTVIHYDPWWNPAIETQATDRAHRIGQLHPVFVYKLITTGTVEEVIQSMQARKQNLFDGILSSEPLTGRMFQDTDLNALFAPLPSV